MGQAMRRTGTTTASTKSESSQVNQPTTRVEYRSLPTPERMLKAGDGVEIGGDDRTGKIIRIMDAPLDRMMTKRMLTGKEYEALNKYRIHWWHAKLSGSPRSPDLNRVFASNPGDLAHMASTERQAYHRDQYRKARALFENTTTENHKMLIVIDNVLCTEMPLHLAGFSIGAKSPYRARERAKELVVKAADILARHWGM